MTKRFLLFAAFLCLVACKDGLGPNATQKPAAPSVPVVSNNMVVGNAAVGSPVVGASVSALCQGGNTYAAATPTGNSGEFMMNDIPEAAFPCVIKVEGGDMGAHLPGAVTLHSIVVSGGSRVNVNTFTDLALSLSVRQATGEADIATWFASMVEADWDKIGVKLLSALNTLRDALLSRGYHVPVSWPYGGFAPFSLAFIPSANPAVGTIDQLLEELQAGMDAASPVLDYAALLPAFLNDPSSALPAAPVDEGAYEESDDAAAIAAIKALAGSHDFVSEANVIGRSNVDRMGSMRGVGIDLAYPACESLGVIESAAGMEGTVPERWRIALSIDAGTAEVSLENLADSSKRISLLPEATDTLVRVPISKPWHWAAVHPEASFYEINKRIPYKKSGQSGTYYYYTSITLGVLDEEVQSLRLADGKDNQCAVIFSAIPMDKLAPLKALAGSYTVTHNYFGNTLGWSDLGIATDGSLTFGGTGPSLAAIDIESVKVHRVNDYVSSADFRVWALTVQANKDISGDGLVDTYDAINLFLNEDGSLRDVQYVYEKDAEVLVAEASFVPVPALPAYDDALATQLVGNGILGKVANDVQQLAITDIATALTLDASGLELFAEENKTPPESDISWRLAIRDTLAIDTPYSCNNFITEPATLVEFGDVIRQVEEDGEISLRSPSQSTSIIGACEIILTQLSTDPATSEVTGVEGKFRALAWDYDRYKFIPLVGFFRALPAPPLPVP